MKMNKDLSTNKLNSSTEREAADVAKYDEGVAIATAEEYSATDAASQPVKRSTYSWTGPKRVALILYALLWLGVGSMLLYKGLNLVLIAATLEQEIALILVVVGIAIGIAKARMVLSKVAKKLQDAVKESTKPYQTVFSPKTFLLIGIMMALGFVLKSFNPSAHILGCIDIAVGAALIQGSTFLVRSPVPISQK